MNQRTSTTIDTGSALERDVGQAVLVLSQLFPTTRRALARVAHGLTIGRGEHCGIVLDGSGVSRQHAEFLREGPIFIVRDAGSRNGTWVDARREHEAALREGTVLRFGDWLGLIERLDPDSLPNAAPELRTAGPFLDALQPALVAASSTLPVVLLGETGTGKEVAARTIHERSLRTGEFVAVNCAAIPSELAEAELFGYRKGAFSGADKPGVGYFRAAHRGTLFLDEVNELRADVQGKLLRALQERAVTPLGESKPVEADARIIVAGQTALRQAVEAGSFRRDLWMRLRGVEVSLPALRERVIDIPVLFNHFRHKFSDGTSLQVESKLIEQLCLYSWPGNVRELELLTQRLTVLHRDAGTLRMSVLPAEYRSNGADPESGASERTERRDVEGMRLAQALLSNGGNVTQASRSVDISRQRAYRLIAGRTVEEFLRSYGLAP